PYAKVKGEAIQSFEAQQIHLQPFFIREIFGPRIRAQVYFQAQLLKTKRLQEIIDDLQLVGSHVLCGKSRHGRARTVVKRKAMQTNEQPGIMVDFYHALDPALIKLDVMPRGNGHEAIRQKCDGIDLRKEFPLVPTVIVLGGREDEGILQRGRSEHLIAQFASK